VVRLEDLQNIRAPALVAVGTRDDITGSPHELAALMPNGRAIDIPDRDHMLAVGDKVFKAAALEFLHRRP
jgi:non-heme chloroperoxidase